MKPTRRTQPQRAVVGRAMTGGLKASLRGATAAGFNPQDAKRQQASNRASGTGSLKSRLAGAVTSSTAKIAKPDRTARRAPRAPKSTGSETVRVGRGKAGRQARRVLKDGLTPRIYSTGKQTNTGKGPRSGEKFRTFTAGGVEFHEYKRGGKTVIVRGGPKKPPANPGRKL